jgi:hypothetical protein
MSVPSPQLQAARMANIAKARAAVRRKTDSERADWIKSKCKVTPSGCWEWQGFRHAKGYGGSYFRGRSNRTHRIMYICTFGDIPKGKLVCHTCDNPPCCNPAHLWLGTIWENGQDAKQKQRCKYQKTTACKNGHAWADGNYRLTKEGFKACVICARTRQRIKAGWPKDLAESSPKVAAGYSGLRR